MPIQSNRSGNRVVIRETASNTYSLASLAVSNNETVLAATISQLWFSTAGTITIARGANTVAVLTGTDHWDLAGSALAISDYNTANLGITFAGAGTLLIELGKTSNTSGTQNQ